MPFPKPTFATQLLTLLCGNSSNELGKEINYTYNANSIECEVEYKGQKYLVNVKPMNDESNKKKA